MFSLGNIVGSIEDKRRQDIRLANHNTISRSISKPIIQNIPRPKMVDKSTMTVVATSSVYCDTTELEARAKELAVLEKFKKSQEEKSAKAALMRAVLGTPKAEVHEADDE